MFSKMKFDYMFLIAENAMFVQNYPLKVGDGVGQNVPKVLPDISPGVALHSSSPPQVNVIGLNLFGAVRRVALDMIDAVPILVALIYLILFI